MAPFASVPTGNRREGSDRPSNNAHSGLPSSLPRFEGFGSTLGGFARSPQISRALPSILRPTEEEDLHLISEQPRESTFVESLQAPLLSSDEPGASETNRNQSFRPTSLLARSLGTLTEVFSRQVGKYASLLVCCQAAGAHRLMSTALTSDNTY